MSTEKQPALEEFQELADLWQLETRMNSNSSITDNHPAARQIVQMGEPVVRLILKRMQDQGGHWFGLLHEITGAQPVSRENRGRIRAMQKKWLDWGRENGYLKTN